MATKKAVKKKAVAKAPKKVVAKAPRLAIPVGKKRAAPKNAVVVRGGRSPLEAALDRYFQAYARHFLVVDGPRALTLPAYTAKLEGPIVKLRLEPALDGTSREVSRRAGAYLLLAGELWGAAAAAETRANLSRLVATLSSHPDGSSDEWDNVYEFEADMDTVVGIEGLAAALLDVGTKAARREAILVLRRLYAVDDQDGSDPGVYTRDFTPRVAPSAIAAEVMASLPIVEAVSGASTPQAVLKRLAPFAIEATDVDLLAIAWGVGSALPHLLYSNHLGFYGQALPLLERCLADEDGAAFEMALGCVQSLAMKLLHRQAYAEAKTLLDRVIAYEIALPESLRARWECRLYLGDPDAEEDWDRAAALDGSREASDVGRCLFWAGDVKDRRNVARSRVAKGLVTKANGGDPFPDRKIAKADLPSAAEKEALLARAKTLTTETIADGEARVSRDMAKARETGAARERGFQADDFVARAKVREASGDLAGALEDYRAARERSLAAGLSWQYDRSGDDVRRLSRALGETKVPPVPPGFDPDWFVAPARTSAERTAAARAWSQQRWKTFPESPREAEASGGPWAYVLLRDVVADGATIWKHALEDGVDLGDRIAFARRAFEYLDPWIERRDASSLESVLDNAHEVAFFGASSAFDRQDVATRKRLYGWVKSLVAAKRIDAESILGPLAGAPWAHLQSCFDEHARKYDTLRDLFDFLSKAKVDVDGIAVVLRAYPHLMKNDWSAYATPDDARALAPFKALTASIAGLDGARVAPALIAWTRMNQKIPDVFGKPKFDAKWLWPLYYAWSKPDVIAFLADVRKGALDNGKSLTTKQRATRKAALAWFDAALATR